MRFGHPKLWIAAFSGLIVGLLAVVDGGRPLPGPLAAAHQNVPELAGGEDCSLCHGGFFSSMAEACLECHAPIAESLATATGLHGALDGDRAGRCALCHGEHHGPEFPMVNRVSFAQAGTAGPDEFDHSIVGFAREGHHLTLACAECHENAEVAVLPAGGRRFMGLSQRCATCHEDPHEGRLGDSCVECHDQSSFEVRHRRGHDEFLPLVGVHGSVDCRECHAEGSEHALERMRGSHDRPEDRRCASCHESPHTEPFLVRAADLADSTPQAGCVECHHGEHSDFAAAETDLTPRQHACSGFALAAPHHELACESCHSNDTETYAARHPGRGPDECRSCHEGPHGAQFDRSELGGADCLSCHRRDAFAPHTFGAGRHAAAGFVLAKRHAELECHACHEDPEGEEPRLFRGNPSRCEACHEDGHDGFFASLPPTETTRARGTCARCHVPTTFATFDERGFHHGRATRFPIAGSHAQTGCEGCHVPAAAPDHVGRTFGRIAKHSGAGGRCASCHVDPHGEDFAAPGLPLVVDGRTGCSRCHDDISFRALPHGFDHGTWTGFALAGAHGETTCSACHEPLRRPDELGRTWARAAGASCADCHEDPHAGQFHEDGAVDCSRCHAGPSTFGELVFDHDRDSRFPLDEAHAELGCSACHRALPKGGTPVVRYRPLGRECADCHGAQKSILLRRKGGKS